MEAAGFSKRLVPVYQTTQDYTPDDCDVDKSIQ